MTHLGWQPEDVQLSMNKSMSAEPRRTRPLLVNVKRRLIKSTHLTKLKKKRDHNNQIPFWDISWGVFCAFDALDELDSQVLNSVAKSNTLDSMNRGASTLMENIRRSIASNISLRS